MFGKRDLVDDLSRDLDRAKARRDTLASDVTTLSAEIAALEARLSEERDRRERARVAAEIDEITTQLADAATAFAPAVARLCEAAAAAGPMVAKAGEFSGFLGLFADEVRDELDAVLAELHRRAEMAHIGDTAPASTPPTVGARRSADNDRMPLLLPSFLRRKDVAQAVDAEDQRSSAA